MLLRRKAKEEFNIEPISSGEMESWLNMCIEVYKGNPCWISEENGIDTVNFAKSVCSEVARLATLGIGIKVEGSSKAAWIQKEIEKIYYQLRDWVEYGCAYGTIILKPNDGSVELYTTSKFEVTSSTDGLIDGVVFQNQKKVGDLWYTRLEYHRFVDDQYVITNRCYVGGSQNDTKKAVDIKDTPWANLDEEAHIGNIRQPLFGVFRTPHANNIDLNSPLGLPVFSEAIQELRDLDIAYSRNSEEIDDSRRTVLLDSDSLIADGRKVGSTPAAWEAKREQLKLPKMVKNVRGDGKEMFYQEINPDLNTDTRLKGINALLNQIAYKVGFSNGHFVFNESTGIQTATGVEAAQQRTIQLIKDVRDKLENCLDGVIYSLSVFAELYGLAPAGNYDAVFNFGDITYSFEEDKLNWYKYAVAGKVPFWYYLVKFEGLTEEEAKSLEKEAKPKAPALFGGKE